ncbi:MAG: hypothetical protein ACUVRC_09375 [Desulfotomaculales bacterium]
MEYRFLENLLQRLFGDAVNLSYRYDPDLPGELSPQLLLEGEVVATGGLPAHLLLKRIKSRGYASSSP